MVQETSESHFTTQQICRDLEKAYETVSLNLLLDVLTKKDLS